MLSGMLESFSYLLIYISLIRKNFGPLVWYLIDKFVGNVFLFIICIDLPDSSHEVFKRFLNLAIGSFGDKYV